MFQLSNILTEQKNLMENMTKTFAAKEQLSGDYFLLDILYFHSYISSKMLLFKLSLKFCFISKLGIKMSHYIYH